MRRYNRRAGRRGKLPAGAIVGIVAAVVLVAAIVTGNILNSCLDDDTYRKLTEGETETTPTTVAPQTRRAPQVQAEAFRLGTSLRTLGDNPPQAVAVPINDGDGKLLYTSPVISYLGLETVESPATNVKSRMESLVEEVPHLIGIWCVTLPKKADDAVVYAAAATDAAVLREFLSMGGSELLLTDLRFDDNGFEATHNYLSALRQALGQDTIFSVAVPLSVAESDVGSDILYTLTRQVPFLTLDLRSEQDIGTLTESDTTGAETGASSPSESAEKSPLLRAQFYLSGYRMRLLLSSSQENLLRSARASVADFLVR